MFFSNKKPSEKDYVISREFCIEFCALIVPYLHKGFSLSDSWDEIKWILSKREADVFEDMLKKKFSSDQIELFSYRYSDEKYGGIKALFILLHHFQDKPSDMIASALTIFRMRVEPTPYETESINATSEKLCDYANNIVDRMN